MSAIAIAAILAQVGAPILSRVLQQRFGQGGQAAGKVIETLASELGTEATPEAVEAEFQANPEAFTEKVLRIEADYAAIHKAAAEATMSYHRLLTGDQDGVDTLTRLWRPVCGILFPLGCLLVLGTVCIAILRGIALDGQAMPLISLVVPIMTAWAGVIGFYVRQRTLEKTTGSA